MTYSYLTCYTQPLSGQLSIHQLRWYCTPISYDVLNMSAPCRSMFYSTSTVPVRKTWNSSTQVHHSIKVLLLVLVESKRTVTTPGLRIREYSTRYWYWYWYWYYSLDRTHASHFNIIYSIIKNHTHGVKHLTGLGMYRV